MGATAERRHDMVTKSGSLPLSIEQVSVPLVATGIPLGPDDQSAGESGRNRSPTRFAVNDRGAEDQVLERGTSTYVVPTPNPRAFTARTETW